MDLVSEYLKKYSALNRKDRGFDLISKRRLGSGTFNRIKKYKYIYAKQHLTSCCNSIFKVWVKTVADDESTRASEIT